MSLEHHVVPEKKEVLEKDGASQNDIGANLKERPMPYQDNVNNKIIMIVSDYNPQNKINIH